MSEEAEPFLGFGAFVLGAAAKLGATVRPFEEPCRAEAGDEIEVTGFVQAIDKCFHGAAITARGVGQRQGEAGGLGANLLHL